MRFIPKGSEAPRVFLPKSAPKARSIKSGLSAESLKSLQTMSIGFLEMAFGPLKGFCRADMHRGIGMAEILVCWGEHRLSPSMVANVRSNVSPPVHL